MFTFNHYNFNVLDLERSLKFYREALGLVPVREKSNEDGSFHLVFLGDGQTCFTLELTHLRERKEPYDLGEGEFHLAMATDDFEGDLAKHRELGCVCQESNGRFYFIEDPDGYWIEIIHKK